MFAVPGWNVSADKLKPEIAPAQPNESSSTLAKSKKRKRPSQAEEVTAANLTDLWERVIEHKKPGRAVGEKLSRKERKRQKQERDGEEQNKAKAAESGGDGDQQSAAQSKSHSGPGEGGGEKVVSEKQLKKQDKEKGKKDKKEKKTKDTKKKQHRDEADNSSSQVEEEKGVVRPTALVPPAKAAAAAPPPKLTPLQASMRDKLVSARFRHLNETLYTRPSAEAYELFRDAPDMFQQYHEGFRRQVAVWPENPIDGYITDIHRRGKVKPVVAPRHHHHHHHQQQQQQQQQQQLLPLPRTSGTCTIADLGCGDARLAAALEKGGAKRKLRVEVLSYDLHGDESAGVTRADIANLPLADGAVDVAVFCLALMGTNWLDFIEEAYRVLRWKGELWVAEIKSRFAPARRTGGGGGTVVEHSVGHRRKQVTAAAGKTKKNKDEEGAAAGREETDLAVEVDGADDRRGETDVSAFVEALRKRGFVLLGDGTDAGVDLRNRMFVKMRFVKSAPAVRGKGAVASAARMHDGGHKKKKFIEAVGAAEGVADEASILKPCVYKLR